MLSCVILLSCYATIAANVASFKRKLKDPNKQVKNNVETSETDSKNIIIKYQENLHNPFILKSGFTQTDTWQSSIN